LIGSAMTAPAVFDNWEFRVPGYGLQGRVTLGEAGDQVEHRRQRFRKFLPLNLNA